MEDILFNAILRNDLTLVKTLLNRKTNIDVRNAINSDCVHISVMNPDILKFLIEKGADVDVLNLNGDTPLHSAVDLMVVETVCMLLYYNADPNVPNRENYTPFMNALAVGSEEIQEILLEYIDDFENLVPIALQYGSPFIEEIVLRGGRIDVKAIKNFNFSDGNLELFKLIWPRISLSENDNSIGFHLIDKLCQCAALENFGKYLDFIIENSSDDVIRIIASSLIGVDLRFLFSRCYSVRCLDQLTKFVCLLLQHGYECSSREVILLFIKFGYCELFKILLHFGSEELEEKVVKSMARFTNMRYSNILPTYLYFIGTSLNSICDRKSIEDIQKYPMLNLVSLIELMKFWAHHSLMVSLTELQVLHFPEMSNIYVDLPSFPSLVQLARDKSREFIVCRFAMVKSSQYYTYVKHLDIPKIYKDILTYERAIYYFNIE